VSNKIIPELAVGQGPYLDKTIPSTGDDKRNLNRGGEPDAGNPLGVTLTITSSIDGVLALSKGVPKLDSLITSSRYDLTVVYRESNRENILGVTNETTGGLSRSDLPKTEGSIPGSRKAELSIGGDDNIGNKVIMSTKSTESISVRVRLSILGDGCLMGESPYHDRLITRRGENDVGILGGGSNAGYPIRVT